MKSHDKIHLKTLLKIANNIQHDSLNYRHAALLGVKHKIISLGVNKEKTHPLQKEYKHSSHCNWTHAEVDCLSNTVIPDKSTLYVIRLNSKNTYAESKPCIGCMELIHHKGIKRVVYSSSNSFEEIYLENV